MLDADSIFERLLHQAANLVPKMSTPKLTNALKLTSSLQQRITETVASRLQQQRGNDQLSDSFRQQISVESVLSLAAAPDTALISVSDANELTRRNSTTATGLRSLDGNYGGVTLFPSLNNLANNSKDGTESATNSDLTSISYPAMTIISPMNTVTAVMSSGGGMGGCGALLVPLVASNHGGTTILHPSITSTSTHLSMVADPSMFVNATNTTTTTTAMSGTPISFIPSNACDTSLSRSPSTRSNLQKDSPGSDRNGQLRTTTTTTKDSIGMKPEPLECYGRVSLGSTDTSLLVNSNNSELTSIAFAQLPPIVPFPSTSTTINLGPMASTPIVGRSNQIGLINSTTSAVALGTTVTTTTTVGSANTTGDSANSGIGPNETVPVSGSKSSAGPGPYKCRECDKEFRILRYLEKHRRIHTGEKPYQCCYCGRQFNDWPNMNRHKRIHTGERPYRCGVCAKTFSQPAVYNEHVKRHTGERPYICTVCAKGFPRAARLAVHMRVHTGERPYPCTSCDRRFSQPHHLAAHLRVHSGDRPYSCPKCDVTFACISNLRRHRKQVHPSSPNPAENSECSDMNTLMDEKKPSLQCLAAVASATETSTSTSGVTLDPTSFLTTSTLGPDTPVALAAAMSGTVLTATGALVPANFLPASSIPGLILTSGTPGGTLIAAPAHLTEQHSHLHPALLAHNSANVQHAVGSDGTTATLIGTSGAGLNALGQAVSVSHSGSSSLGAQSENLLKSVSSSTVSFMFPTVLTSTANADALRPTSVAFLTPTGEIDRSCTALATTGPDGGLVLNHAGGDTVYLEPLDPRITLEPGHQFTLATIPTSHPHGSATIISPHHSGTHLVGHQVQLQPGPHGTQIAFTTTNLPQHGTASQLLNPNATIFTTNTTAAQSTIQTTQPSTTVIFPPPTAIAPSGLSTQQQQSVLQTSVDGQTPSQLLHYHRPVCSNSGSLPGRPASTPTQQQAAMLVPIAHTPPVSSTATTPTQSSESADGTNNITVTSSWPVTTGGTFLTLSSSHLCPVSSASSGLHEEHMDTTSMANSRPSSVLSNSSSLGAITAATSAPDPNI